MVRFLQNLLGSKSDPDSEPHSGDLGEQLATEWLQRERRFRVLTRNWRSPKDLRDELDLICQDRDVLVFVEVKARTEGALVPGYFAVNRRKKRALRRAIRTYVAQLRRKPSTIRFDIVEVTLAGAGSATPKILHFENVELFSKYFRG